MQDVLSKKVAEKLFSQWIWYQFYSCFILELQSSPSFLFELDASILEYSFFSLANTFILIGSIFPLISVRSLYYRCSTSWSLQWRTQLLLFASSCKVLIWFKFCCLPFYLVHFSVSTLLCIMIRWLAFLIFVAALNSYHVAVFTFETIVCNCCLNSLN